MADSVETENFSPDEISLVFLEYHSSHSPISPNPCPLTRDVLTKHFIKPIKSLIIFLVQPLPWNPYFIKRLIMLFNNNFSFLSSLPCKIPLIFLIL